jgi:Fe2+ transport system protein FeoA
MDLNQLPEAERIKMVQLLEAKQVRNRLIYFHL